MITIKSIWLLSYKCPYECMQNSLYLHRLIFLYIPQPQHLFNVNLVYLIKNLCNLYSEEVEFGVTKWCGYISKYIHSHLFIHFKLKELRLVGACAFHCAAIMYSSYTSLVQTKSIYQHFTF